MVPRKKGIYRANAKASSIFFVGGMQAPILDTTYHERSPEWLLLLLVPRYIALIPFCLKVMHWRVSHKCIHSQDEVLSKTRKLSIIFCVVK